MDMVFIRANGSVVSCREARADGGSRSFQLWPFSGTKAFAGALALVRSSSVCCAHRHRRSTAGSQDGMGRDPLGCMIGPAAALRSRGASACPSLARR